MARRRNNPELRQRDDDDFDELGDLVQEIASKRPSLISAISDAAARHRLITDLVAIRKAVKLTQSQVAERMQTTQSAVSDLENGTTDFFLSTAQRYARAVTARLNVTIDMPADSPWLVTRFYERSPARLHEAKPISEPDPALRAWQPPARKAPPTQLTGPAA